MKKVLAVLGVLCVCGVIIGGLYYFTTKDDQGFVDNHPGAVWVPIEDYTRIVEETSVEYIVGADGQEATKIETVTRVENVNQVADNSNAGGNDAPPANQGGNNVATEASNGKVDSGNVEKPTQGSGNVAQTQAPTQSQTTKATQADIWWSTLPANNGGSGNSGIGIYSYEKTAEGSSNGLNFELYTNGNGGGYIKIVGYSGGPNLVIPQFINGYEVTAIGDRAFMEKGITSISLPSSISKIGAYAFAGNCGDGSLSVTLPAAVNVIEAGSFAGINVKNVPSGYGYSIHNGCVYKYNSMLSASGLATDTSEMSYAILSGTKVIEEGAFYGCNKLRKIYMASSVETLEMYAFYGCSSLSADLILPENVTSIPQYCFRGCTSLGKIQMMYASYDVVHSKEKGSLCDARALESKTKLIAADGLTLIN